MKALVTGANGLIGSHLVKELLRQGHDVRAFVRSTSDVRSLEGAAAEMAYGDILDADTLVRAAAGCDVLFHAAAVFSYYRLTPEELMNLAKAGTCNALTAAGKVGIKRVVLTSSSVVLGSTRLPSLLDESTRAPEEGASPYALSKIVQEEVGFRLAADLGIDMMAVCPTICVGPHDYGLTESNAVIVNYLRDPFRATWPGGCNIVSVRDVAEGHILAATKGTPGQRYVLGSENLEWSAIHRMISELCGIEGPLMTAGHTASYLAATAQEIISFFTNARPLATRVQAKMVGRYYWYQHHRAGALGYSPMPARKALAKAISWLATSDHISASLRSSLRLSQEVYDQRQ